MAINDLLLSNDPLSNEAIQMLIKYREEDLYVDYKESFDPHDNKQWLGMAKDIMAFANTNGGYLVLGVRSTPFEIIGLAESIVKILADANNILQKANRYVGPTFANVRTKIFKIDMLNIVVIYIPESKGKTHVVIKEASHKYPDGRTDTILRPGMIYIRRSGTNQIITPDDMELILSKRIDYYKDSLFDKIAKVVKAPIEYELVIRDPKIKQENVKKVQLSSDKDALLMKGVSFTVAPKTDEEEISGWIAIQQRDSEFSPGAARLWYMYSQRSTLKDTISIEQTKALIRFNLGQRIPTFYWLKSLDSESRKGILKESFEAAKSFELKVDILHVSAFEGRAFYRTILKKMGNDNVKRLNPRSRKYPDEGPCSFFNQSWLPSYGKGLKKTVREKGYLEDRLGSLSVKLSCSTGTNDERWEAIAIDCYLYNI